MWQTMNHILRAQNRGWHSNLSIRIVDLRKEKFAIKGKASSNYETNAERRKSTSDIEATLSSASVVMRSTG